MIDLYCERLGPGILAEPVNALTNLAFLVAAFAAWRLANQYRSMSVETGLLIGLMVAIGVGSGLFHTFATNWARVLDVLPILLFQIAYLWIYGSRIIMMKTIHLTGLVIIFLIAAFTGRQFQQLFNGALIYLPAFMLLLGLGLYHYHHARTEPALLLWATALFSVSLFLRSIDMTICQYMPIGTHYFWHLFNGLLVYLVFRGFLLNSATSERGIEQ
ncbi:MAG: ceramidase [Gammaproteobacteria bacterium]|nr:ceramidase [Gammaproteobacteria bacterium]